MKINQPQYIVDENGNKTAIILDLKIFNKLLEELEDLYDVAEAEKIIKKGGRTFTMEEIEKACAAKLAKKRATKKVRK
jgi:predicted DNA-binding protein